VPPTQSQDDELNGGPVILDIGTGNGILPICLAEAGYNPRYLAGIDYSNASVELAKRVSQTREVEEITFKVYDFIRENPRHMQSRAVLSEDTPLETKESYISEGSWDLLSVLLHIQHTGLPNFRLDKGTFDAISLSSGSNSLIGEDKSDTVSAAQSPHATDLYPVQVEALLKPGGYFLITCELSL
jgi:SAM-dependent methyltransferase